MARVSTRHGDDTPAVLSERPHLFHDYFGQRFVQVTNPPIDLLRERLGDVVEDGAAMRQ